jgi:hypothetical protein
MQLAILALAGFLLDTAATWLPTLTVLIVLCNKDKLLELVVLSLSLPTKNQKISTIIIKQRVFSFFLSKKKKKIPEKNPIFVLFMFCFVFSLLLSSCVQKTTTE